MSTERVHFRLILMPCCGQALCWVNPRLPSHCPECGKNVYPQVRSCVSLEDPDAILRLNTDELHFGVSPSHSKALNLFRGKRDG